MLKIEEITSRRTERWGQAGGVTDPSTLVAGVFHALGVHDRGSGPGRL